MAITIITITDVNDDAGGRVDINMRTDPPRPVDASTDELTTGQLTGIFAMNAIYDMGEEIDALESVNGEEI